MSESSAGTTRQLLHPPFGSTRRPGSVSELRPCPPLGAGPTVYLLLESYALAHGLGERTLPEWSAAPRPAERFRSRGDPPQGGPRRRMHGSAPSGRGHLDL